MKLSYPKIQKILDLINEQIVSIDTKVNKVGSLKLPNPPDSFADDYYPEEKKEKEFLEEIKNDFMTEINKVNFVFEIQTGTTSAAIAETKSDPTAFKVSSIGDK